METLKATADTDVMSPVSDYNLGSTDEKAKPDEVLPILKIKQYFKKTMTDVIIRKSQFVKIWSRDIESDYKICEVLGTGTYGKVFKAENKQTGDLRAVKQIKRAKIKRFVRFMNEINTLAWLDHPNIVKLYEVYQDKEYIYLVMELCTGGELYQRICEHEFLTEQTASILFRQVMQAIYYCHKNKICHRDIKPENFMFKSGDPDSGIKLVDFGFARSYVDVEAEGEDKAKYLKMKSQVGTAFFIAPEVLCEDYTEACDVWSAGVMLYTMLCGYPPFFGETQDDVMRSILVGEFEFDDDDVWSNVSDSAKDLIRKCLCPEDERISAKMSLRHPWIANKQSSDKLPNENLARLEKFRKANKLKKATLAYFASRSEDADIKNHIANFHSLDKNSDGYITLSELRKGYETADPSSLNSILKGIDIDNNGAIDFTEFIAANLDSTKYTKSSTRLHEAFRNFDTNGDGEIDEDELAQIFHTDKNLVKKDIIKEIDINGDGRIDYDEFEAMFKEDT